VELVFQEPQHFENSIVCRSDASVDGSIESTDFDFTDPNSMTKPAVGLEPTTYGLQNRSSTN
jgi:hypothetical protein